MSMRTATVAGVLCVAALAASGCGGDDGGDRATAPQRFVEQADAICAEANKKEEALGAPGPGWVYEGQFDDRAFLTEFNAIGRMALRRLEKLKPPAEQREVFATVVSSIRVMVRALDGRIAGIKTGKGDHSAQKNAYYSAYTDLAAAAGRIGLSECQGVLL